MGDGKNILFEKFEIIECLKKDAGACVYIAFHIYLGKQILLKTLDRTKIGDPAMMKRFQREAKTLARLDFDNIIKVLDFGADDTFFYISFEYFPSRNLRQVIDEKDLNDEQKKHVFRQIVNGVAFAHKHKIIHRDLKPENILVNDSLHVKVADFGLALIEGEESLTVQTSIVGTPGYMSPEQIRGEKLTPQSDLFSLGVVGYELFTGVNPFVGKDAGATLHNILSPTVDLDGLGKISDPFSTLLDLLLKKSKSGRLKNIDDAQKMLVDKDDSRQPAATSSEPKHQGRIWKAAAPAAIVIVAVVLFLIFQRQADVHKAASTTKEGDLDSTVVVNESKPVEQPPITDGSTISPADDEGTSVLQSIVPPSEQSPGRLLVRCTPWAHVFIDSIYKDTTPMEDALELSEGEYQIRLEHPKYPAYMKNIRINAAEMLTVAVDMDTLLGYFTCNIYPWGDVVIDGKKVGQTPFAGALPVYPGKHVLVVKNQHYKDVVSEFFVTRKDTFHYQLNFENAAKASADEN